MNPIQHLVKLLSSVVVSGLLVVGLCPPEVLESQALGLDGSFVSTGYNNPISVSNLSLKAYDADSSSNVSVSSLTPTATYRIAFDVSDYDGLNDVLIEVSLMHDPDGFVDSDENGIDDSFESAAGINPDGDQFDFYWYPSLGQDPSLLNDGNALTSWTLVSHNLNTVDLNTVSAHFTFDVIVSKAAIADSQWTLNVRVMDDYTGTAPSPTMSVARLDQLSIQWYGEITTSSDTLAWGTLDHGTSYASQAAKTQVTTTVWANGPFQQKVSADAIWSGARQSDTALGLEGERVSASLVDDPSTQPDQSFAIRANLDDSDLKGFTAGFVQLSSAMQAFKLSDVKTTEAGITSSLSFYLSLSERFQNGAYSGSIYVGIANPTEQ